MKKQSTLTYSQNGHAPLMVEMRKVSIGRGSGIKKLDGK
jgi:hypothetical protein